MVQKTLEDKTKYFIYRQIIAALGTKLQLLRQTLSTGLNYYFAITYAN